MAILSNVVIPGDAENLSGRTVLLGEQFQLELTVTDIEGQIINVTGWNFSTATAHYRVSVSGTSLSNWVKQATPASRNLAVTTVDGPTGRINVGIPSDLVTASIMPNAVTNRPAVVVTVTGSSPDTPPVIEKLRRVYLYTHSE